MGGLKIAIILLLCLLFGVPTSEAQPSERRVERQEYIDMWKDEAVRQMLEYGIPASITLAQGILESANGNSSLARYANNHFGIKCHNWEGPGFYIDDDSKDECFRKYFDAEDSYHDHSEFLSTRGRYAFLFELRMSDYKGWAKGLRKAGYATNPKYPQLLISLIERHDLAQFDKVSKMPRRKPRKEETEIVYLAKVEHIVTVHDNNINFVIVKKGDSLFKIAKEFNVDLRMLFRYNDLNKKDLIHAGDIIYIQPKRKKSKQVKYHVVTSGETMRGISQKYGVQLKALYKKNNMIRGTEPVKGQKVSLKKRVAAQR
jgi:LysM repeat protein